MVNRTRLLPPVLRGYQASWLRPDVVAGLTLVAIAVPEQLATARLVNLPAVTGLYAFVAASLVFVLVGANRLLSVGADSTIAPILAAGVTSIAAVSTPQYAELVALMALMVGVIVATVGLLRLGWISELLSTPVVTGVLAGIAVDIAVRQVPALLGLAGGGSTTVGRVRQIVSEMGHTSGWSLGIGLAVFTVIVVAEQIDRRIPGALLGLVASIVAVVAVGLKAHGVAVLGQAPGGLPSFHVPSANWTDIGRLLAPALTVAFICVAQTAATVRATDPTVSAANDFNRDLVGVGLGSVAAGFARAFAVDSSPPRTEVVKATGGRSQLAGLVAALLVLGFLLAGTGILHDLPLASLGAILLFIATRLFRWRDLREILRFDRVEFALAMITLVAVAIIGIEQGVIVAAVLSVAERTYRVARPRDVILGREPGTDHWVPPDVGRSTEQVPGVVVYLMYAPLWYGNADHFRLRIHEVLDAAAQPVHALVLDANAMSDIDYTGAKTLGQLADDLRGQGVTVAIARASHLVHRDLKHGGLLEAIGVEHLFTTVDGAVSSQSLTTRSDQRPESN